MQKILFDRHDISVEFDEVVVIVQVDGHLFDLSVKTSKPFDETEGGEDKELFRAHQHEGG